MLLLASGAAQAILVKNETNKTLVIRSVGPKGAPYRAVGIVLVPGGSGRPVADHEELIITEKTEPASTVFYSARTN